MSENLDLALRVKADVKQALTELDKLERELKQQDRAADKAADGHRQLDRSIDGSTRKAGAATTAFRSFRSALAGAGAAAAAFYVTMEAVERIRGAIRVADQFNQLEARVRRATTAQGDFNKVWAEIGNISDKNGQTIDTTVKLFEGISRSAPEIGATRNEVLAVTRAVQQLGIMSGATGEQMSNSMLQFSQAMAGGVVRAEEWNSILENTPGIAEAIANGMGLTVGQLRKAVASGRVLSKDVFASLLQQAPQIAKEMEGVASSIERAGQRWETNTNRILHELDRRAGVSEFIAGLMNDAADAAGEWADELAEGNNQSGEMVKREQEINQLVQKRLQLLKQMQRLEAERSDEPSQREWDDSQLARYSERIAQIDAQLKELRETRDKLLADTAADKPKSETKKEKPGAPNTLDAATEGRRQALIDQLDASTAKLRGPADPSALSTSAGVFTLNRLRDKAETKFDKGDIAAGLADLERAKTIVDNLAQSGEVSEQYLQTQIKLVRELAESAKDKEMKIPVKLGIEEGAKERAADYVRLRREFEAQNQGLKLAPQIDEAGTVQRLQAHLASLQATAAANPIAVEVVFRQKGGLGEPININVGGQTIETRANAPLTSDLVNALRREAAAEGVD